MSRGPVQIVAVGPVACGSRLWRRGGVLRASIFVKATFGLVPEGRAEIAPPADLVDGDRLAPPVVRSPDTPPAHALAAASETAPYLASAGVVVVGATAYAPLELPTPAMAARFALYRDDVPIVDKLLHVFGDRTQSAPTPAAMRSMPLGYERAYGGVGVDDNPVGVGASMGGPLPNVIDPGDPRRPAGFGPINPAWGARARQRAGAAATRDERGVLVFADDLDFRAENPAPLDQQTEFFRGDEWIVLDGMHPTRARFRSRLPGVRARARFALDVPWTSGPPRPLELEADLLVIDAERLTASLVFRGQLPLDDVEGVSKLKVFVALEVPGAPIAWPAEAPSAPPGDSALPGFPGLDEETATTEPVSIGAAVGRGRDLPFDAFAEVDDAPAHVDQTTSLNLDEKLRAIPVAPFALPPPGARAPAAPIPGAPWSTEPAAPPPALDGDRTAGVRIAPTMLAPIVATPFQPARAEPASPVAAAGRSNLAASPPNPEPPPLLGPIATASSVRETNGDDIAEIAVDASKPVADPIREGILARAARRESLDGLEGAGVDLSDADLSGRSLVGAKLRGAKLARARLQGADLSGADLADADLTEASLDEARLGGAVLTNATLVRATFGRAAIGGASFVGARAASASFEGARGERPDFATARLDGASFVRADLPRAILRGASLAGARFEAATLAEADLADASGDAPVFDGATLVKAKASGAVLARASFRQANLAGSSWERAKLVGASFEGANLSGASFVRAACAGAVFADAEMSRADLQRMNAERAEFRGASLDGADLRKMSAPDATFVDVAMHRAHADKANFVRASLASADLRGTTFRAAILAGANLARAHLEGVDLRDADLRNAVLHGASREGAKLDGAILTGVQDDPELRPAKPVT